VSPVAFGFGSNVPADGVIDDRDELDTNGLRIFARGNDHFLEATHLLRVLVAVRISARAGALAPCATRNSFEDEAAVTENPSNR
jgi:hypothetical protein